jgi:hypothetical protein
MPLGWGGNTAIHLPWFTGVVPGEIVALPGQIVLEETIAEDAIVSRQLFCLDPALTREGHWFAPLAPAETNSGTPNPPRPGQDVMVVALMLEDGLFERNLRFLEIARDLARNERILPRRGRRLAAAIQGLLDTEKAIIDRSVEAEREALVGESSDQEIRARKLNVLLQFQQAVNEQLERMLCGSRTGALVFDRAPDTLEGMLEGKDDEAARILEWLEDREDKLEGGRSAVRGLFG